MLSRTNELSFRPDELSFRENELSFSPNEISSRANECVHLEIPFKAANCRYTYPPTFTKFRRNLNNRCPKNRRTLADISFGAKVCIFCGEIGEIC